MTTIQQVSDALGEARARADVSVTDLSKRAGVARAALYRFVNGEDIRLSTLLATTDALGLDIVLVPKSVSASLQSAGSGHAPSPPPGRSVNDSGPRSAVSARLAKLKSNMKNRGRV